MIEESVVMVHTRRTIIMEKNKIFYES